MDGFNALWHARDGPRGHRHPGRGRAAARGRGQDAARTLGREAFIAARVEVEGGVGRHDHPPAQAARAPPATGRASASRWTPGLSRGGARGLRAPLGRGADLPGRLHRQLVPALPDRAVRPRGGARGAGRRVRLHQVRAAHPRHRAARRPSSATPRSPSTRRTSATRSTWARRSRSPRSTGTITHEGRRRRAPSTRSSAPASSRSRPATTPTDFEIGRRHDLPDPQRHRLRRQDDRRWPASTRGSIASRPASASSRTCRRSGSSSASSPTGTRSASATAARRWWSRSSPSSGT